MFLILQLRYKRRDYTQTVLTEKAVARANNKVRMYVETRSTSSGKVTSNMVPTAAKTIHIGRHQRLIDYFVEEGIQLANIKMQSVGVARLVTLEILVDMLKPTW